ncbi:TIGR02450 family Trp-rich protein [Halopseudomonas xinjiangensis]|uniref:TIGR02450 family Trp-rich protein n=1 Tax=Halopseudomonas xinjiangensis TaxID=487184 RepID=UPI000B8111F4|nr:TIGR02450 family Trp-rich protein [Halopseudomonas xinjiangensis]
MSSKRAPAHRINPAKLLHSKWTAVTPANRERHFMVVKEHVDDLERVMDVDWRQLTNLDTWIPGWR